MKDEKMALGLSNGPTGDLLPIITWDARAGRMFKVERTQGANGWESNKIDVTAEKPTFMVDFGGITVGWVAFLATGPDFQMVPLGGTLPARPSAEHKQGFRMRVFSPKFFNGVREFSSSAKSLLGSIDNLHSTFLAAPEAAAGQMPVVRLDGATPIVTKGPTGNVTSYAPILTVVSWADRVEEFGERTVSAPTAGARLAPNAAQAPPSKHVPPPVTTPAASGGGAVPSEMPFAICA